MKSLKYTHAAKTKYDVNKLYQLDELEKEMDIERIKIFFTPVDFEWEVKEKKRKYNFNEFIEGTN